MDRAAVARVTALGLALSAGEAHAQRPARSLDVPWPSVPDDARVDEAESDAGWYLGRPRWTWFTLRASPGLSVMAAGPGQTAAFALDLDAGAALGLHRGEPQWGLVPLVGYTLRAPGDDHQLSAGLGVSMGVALDDGQLMLTPRVVYDTATTHVGARASLLYRFPENGFSVELGYQTIPDDARHEVRATVGIDLGLVAAAVME